MGSALRGRNLSRGCTVISSQPINPGVLMKPIDSPLLQRYKKLLAERQGDPTLHDPDRERAEQVIAQVQRYRRSDGVLRFGFWPSARRLELLSNDLIGEHSEQAPGPPSIQHRKS